MMTLEQVMEQLKDRNIKRVATLADIPYSTILRLSKGNSPSYETIKKLSDYFEKREAMK